MGDFYLQMGKRISNLRKLHNMTQEQLAEVMDVSVKHISSIERGKSSLSLEKLVDLSDYFGCTLDYLIKGKTFNANIDFIPKCILDILDNENKDEARLFSEYLTMYAKLRQNH